MCIAGYCLNFSFNGSAALCLCMPFLSTSVQPLHYCCCIMLADNYVVRKNINDKSMHRTEIVEIVVYTINEP